MLTQCPSCQTIFRVTQDVLAAADGQVRCGRCGEPFDGIKGFIDHHQLLAARRSSSLLKGGAVPATASAEHAKTRPIPNEPVTLAAKLPLAKEVESERDEPAAQAARSIAPDSAEPAPIPAPTPTPSATVQLTASPPSSPAKSATTTATPAAAATKDVVVSDGGETAASDLPKDVTSDMELALQRPKKPSSGAWKFVVPPLLLLLSVQMVHYFRQDIANHQRFGPSLIAIYTGLGQYLAPQWRLKEYEVRQLGVLANPGTPGTLKVRASIINRAAFPQPYPLLRLVLEDRFGQQVQAREFEPAEYAQEKVDGRSRLPPNERIDASLTIVDPGTQAEGFRFDVCLRQPNGVFCADDEPPVM